MGRVLLTLSQDQCMPMRSHHKYRNIRVQKSCRRIRERQGLFEKSIVYSGHLKEKKTNEGRHQGYVQGIQVAAQGFR